MSQIEAANLQQEDDLTDIDKSRKMTLIWRTTLSSYHMDTHANFFFWSFIPKKRM